MNKTVVLGVTSGIAAYKTVKLVNLLREEGIGVYVIMTDKAKKMIDPKEFEKASGHKVHTELFDEDFDYKKILAAREVDHIALADKADAMIIAPATANVIAKLANGIADDFLTTTALAVTKSLIICPSMNVNMWTNPIVQENIAKLKTHGFHIIDPTAGMLACGYEGVGRLAEINDIKNYVMSKLETATSLKGQKILITAGGTIEKIDEVRYITNRSSGKMGIALAEECYQRGAEVLLLRAKHSVAPRYHIHEKLFESADELYTLIKQNIKDYHYCYHAAAVSDFAVANKTQGKLSSDKPITLTLEPQIKILEQIKKLNPEIRLIAFKAEYESDIDTLKQKAEAKLRESQADAVIANDISRKDRGFESDDNEIVIVLPNGNSKQIPLSSKKEIARQIVEYISKAVSSNK
ncbi:MAG TPA: bifunctional phosphopantothenoylcysteine decarboxylase/phosphopantothenate--cysteine ligase CoaBC [Candidatus Acidoferrales bacterium]|nr:bifunctional phosphopantothenoylcysteine decarboxylase/phosphopantothenate--cysteine ligase CoaBC [Candidatus Acidoferrales bacterium]